MLRIENLQVRYGGLLAVRGISLRVEQGELVGLIGPNGAGKSTTLSTICGVVSPAAGKIEFRGESLLGKTPEAVSRLGVALVPEGRQILGTLTVDENLRLGATVRRDAEIDRDLEGMLERFPILERYRHTPAGRLSGGEQQQLAIGRALMARPRLLLMDEPSLGLAPRMVDLVFELLQELRQQGMTMLLVEQNARRTLQIADRTYVLQQGLIRHETSGAEVDMERIEETYLGLEVASSR